MCGGGGVQGSECGMLESFLGVRAVKLGEPQGPGDR
jgi:hypothetical protein